MLAEPERDRAAWPGRCRLTPIRRRGRAARRRVRVRRGGGRAAAGRGRRRRRPRADARAPGGRRAAGAGARLGGVLRAAASRSRRACSCRAGAPRSLVELAVALAAATDHPPVVVDLCCGTGRDRGRDRRVASPTSSCTPRTSTPMPSPAPGCNVTMGRSTRATCTTPCRSTCAAGSTCSLVNAPYVPTDEIAADAARGPAARAPRRPGRREPTGSSCTDAWRRAHPAWLRPGGTPADRDQPRQADDTARLLRRGRPQRCRSLGGDPVSRGARDFSRVGVVWHNGALSRTPSGPSHPDCERPPGSTAPGPTG